MKRVLSFIAILGLSVLLVTGCSTSGSSSKETPQGSEVASSVGGLASTSTQVDGTATGLMGVSLASAGLQSMAVAPDLTYTNGWWTFTFTQGTLAYTFKVRAYTAAGAEITTQAELGTMNKISMALTLTMGSSLDYRFGTESNPLTFDGLQSGTKSLNGPISVTVTDGSGNTYSLSLTYSGITLDASGYPASGSSTFSLSSSDYVDVAGTITYNGNTASLVFTAPDDLTGTTYTIDMLTGNVSAAGL